ncbi:uncharacterized protein LOC131947161 [Physella acuta]|uniref:uncharacterized protein LOC131947161 n=1 Tax=Physella acuta TaxID=109671 RepID=UPI0027DDE31B|nr:uncharacterized protein LOC131947161 [Physella acuta]
MEALLLSPTVEAVENLSRKDLITVVKKLNLDYIVTQTSRVLKDKVIVYFINEGMLDESLLSEVLAREVEIVDREFEARLKLEREVQMKRLEYEFGIIDSSSRSEGPSQLSVAQTLAQFCKLVPKFDESDLVVFFNTFENMAESCQWPSNVVTTLLSTVLIGKAATTYQALSREVQSDYKKVKAAILKAYEITPEAYRIKFRKIRKQQNQTYVEFLFEKEKVFSRWLHSENVDDFDKLRSLILREDFLNAVPEEIRLHILDNRITDIKRAAESADTYELVHKKSQGSGTKYNPVLPLISNNPSAGQLLRSRQSTQIPRVTARRLICHYCSKPGHIIKNCFLRQRDNREYIRTSRNALPHQASPKVNLARRDDPTPACPQGGNEVTTTFVQSSYDYPLHQPVTSAATNGEESRTVGFTSFMTDAVISNPGDPASSRNIVVLRDTGASQSLLLRDSLNIAPETNTGDVTIIQGVGAEPTVVPLHKFNLRHQLIQGDVILGVIDSIPVPGVHFLLGNDLAGSKVHPQEVQNPFSTDPDGENELFFWPRMHNDDTRYCRHCKNCQLVGNPNQNIPKADETDSCARRSI